MELILRRRFFKEKYTIGRLYADNMFLCSTIEDKIRDLQDLNHDGDFDDKGEGKIYSETAIPCGKYKVILNESPKFKRVLPLLVNVPGFTGIRIHRGTDEADTSGCIIVGDNTIKGKLTNSGYWETFIVNMIEEALNNKENINITITE